MKTKMMTKYIYRKWWHRLTLHKTMVIYMPDKDDTFYYDMRYKKWEK